MKVIGITGGVGAGKTQVLHYLQERTDCRIIIADQAAHALEEPGEVCYEKLVALLGKEILREDGKIDKTRMAARIIGDSASGGKELYYGDRCGGKKKWKP